MQLDVNNHKRELLNEASDGNLRISEDLFNKVFSPLEKN